MDKDDRDLLYTAIGEFNGFSYNITSELFTKNGSLVIGEPLFGVEETKNVCR